LFMMGGQDVADNYAYKSDVWRLRDNNWSKVADLIQKVAYGSAIAIGNSIFIVGGTNAGGPSYSQRIDFEENNVIANVQQIGVLDEQYYWPALSETSQDKCVSD